MLKTIITTIAILVMTSALSGQSNYSKVKIILNGQSLESVAKLGLEVDHGQYAKGKYLINDFAAYEIQQLKDAGFEIQILVEDAEAYYQQQIYRARPTKSISTRDGETCKTINTPITAVKYTTPEHYKPGTMGGYYTYEELLATLDSMHQLYPHLISAKAPISDTQTFEGRDIYYLKISDNPDTDETDEPQALYTALHHAREPNSLTQMIFYMWYLLENYATDDEIKYIVDHSELYFVPCVNPDGYIDNQTTNPNGGGLRRKNKREVDLNRNYGYKWGYDDTGSSPDKSDQTYRGTTPFSEAETQNIKTLCDNNNFQIALNCHTFGNLLIHPWGYSDMPTDDHHAFRTLGKEMIKHNHFNFGTGTETVGYTVNGDSDDWMYGDRNILSLTPEIGPTIWGFWPPSYAIDSLNKTAMYMNLIAAKSLHTLIKVKGLNTTNQVLQPQNNLDLEFTNIGLTIDTIAITIQEISGYTDFEDQSFKRFFNKFEQFNISLPYEVTNLEGEQLQFVIRTSDSYGEHLDTITLTIDPSVITSEIYTLWIDSINNFDNWDSPLWSITDNQFHTSNYSITDSPNGQYLPDTSNILNLNSPINLTNETYAELQFYARWEIEQGWDYAELQISTDQVNYHNLCGKYSVLGNGFQNMDEPLYDGIQEDWVLEYVNLEDYLGQIVYIRFVMTSDKFSQMDGIYIDDISLLLSRNYSSTTSPELIPYIVQPNPFDDNIRITYNDENDNSIDHITLYSIDGSTAFVKSIPNQSSTINISTESLAPGIYILSIRDTNGITRNMKVVK